MEQQFVNICLKMVGFFGSLHSMPQQQGMLRVLVLLQGCAEPGRVRQIDEL